MDTLEFKGPHGWLQIFCVVVDKSKSPLAAQDIQHLRYAAGGHGFSGASDSFVAEADLRAFCKGLLDLADGGNAETRLEGQQVRGLDVQMRPGPERNRISIEGRIVQSNYRTLDEKDGLYIWDCQFGFWVERETLRLVRKANWVRHYAGSEVDRA
jgi:hypothetical protein